MEIKTKLSEKRTTKLTREAEDAGVQIKDGYKFNKWYLLNHEVYPSIVILIYFFLGIFLGTMM